METETETWLGWFGASYQLNHTMMLYLNADLIKQMLLGDFCPETSESMSVSNVECNIE